MRGEVREDMVGNGGELCARSGWKWYGGEKDSGESLMRNPL
jgi:hypothetical protein